MNVFLNGKKVEISEKTLFSAFPKKENNVTILNGFQTSDDTELNENDEIYIIEKGVMPPKEELEAMMSARHTPKVHEILKKSSVAIAGLGGLGSNIAVSLARIGVGKLFLVDFDIVEPSNLNRQSYYVRHLGMLKTEAMKEQLKEMLPQIKVHAVSALTGDGMDKLQVYLQPGNTIALLGSSGVGKSTLVNALAGTEIMKTGEIREKDAKGRHTTTYRELIELPNNVVIIDTPGMREIGLCDVDEGIDDTFEDIAELAAQCRFRDCTHINEPRCAVRQALENGQLSKERFELYRSLHVESRKSADMKAIAKARKALNKTRKR